MWGAPVNRFVENGKRMTGVDMASAHVEIKLWI
jgi:hypothetical protein